MERRRHHVSSWHHLSHVFEIAQWFVLSLVRCDVLTRTGEQMQTCDSSADAQTCLVLGLCVVVSRLWERAEFVHGFSLPPCRHRTPKCCQHVFFRGCILQAPFLGCYSRQLRPGIHERAMFGQTKIGVLQESRLARSPRYSATVEGQRAQAPVSRCSGVAAWHRCVEKHMLPVFIGTEERLSGLF